VLLLRRYAARALDILAVLVVVAAVARFVVLPRLHRDAAPAPPVSLATLDGRRFDLERQRGRLVFLDFWATWCEPCQASIPMVQHFKRTHPGVDVLSVDVGEETALVRPFVTRFSMRDVALDPDQTVAHAFGIDGFPTLVAVDPTGRVRARWIGFDPDIERAMSEAVTRYAAGAKS
jgi:cytochrome c biogenesis protein CcmG/thiol:disulfide interchange protein DsbE